jgi:uncharacterized protein (DUF433 family)
MSTQIATHIELRKNRDGQDRAFLAGTRVRVQDVYVLAEIQGLDADQIVQQLPHLTLGQVHAALSYFFDHREQVLEEIRQDEALVKLMRVHLKPQPLAFGRRPFST